MNYEHKAIKLTTTMRLCLITQETHQLSKTTQHTRVGVGMLSTREKQQDTLMRGVGCTDLAKNSSEDSIVSQFFLDSS